MVRKDLLPDHEERLTDVVQRYEAQIITRLNDEYQHHARRSDRVADKIASFGGSWAFIALYGPFLACGWHSTWCRSRRACTSTVHRSSS